MMNNFFYGWMIISLFFLIMEMSSPGLFFFLSFFIGGIISALISLIYDSFIMQSLIFLSVSGGAFYVLSYWVKKFIAHQHTLKTNIYALKGKHAQVTSLVTSSQAGAVRVGGQIWSAYSLRDEIIEKESIVEIIEVKGAYLIVKKQINSKG